MLTTDQVHMITMDVLQGAEPRVLGPEADAFRMALAKDIALAKKNHWVLELPFEIPNADEAGVSKNKKIKVVRHE